LIVPMTFAVWSTLYKIFYGSAPRWRRHWGGSHGSNVSALCRSGRAQGVDSEKTATTREAALRTFAASWQSQARKMYWTDLGTAWRANALTNRQLEAIKDPEPAPPPMARGE
jgi:hypothetical protein